MEDRIVRISAIATFCLMLVVCALFFYLPDLHKYEDKVRQQYLKEAALRDNIRRLDELSGLELLQYNNDYPSRTGEEESEFSQQLRLVVPEGVDAEDIEIENNIMHRTLTITFPGATEDYMYRYPMLGRPDHILDLNYECVNDTGRLEIVLDGVYEYLREDDGEYFYLDFVKPHEKYDYILVIDAGHGGKASGALREEVLEKNLNLGMVLELKKILDERKSDSLGVYYTRTEDVNPTLEERVALANDTEADLFISIHNDAAKRQEDKASGTTVLYQGEKGEAYDAKALAEMFSEAVTETVGSENRGAVVADDLYIIRHSDVPVLLIEVGFMSNPKELKNLNTSEYQHLAAEGIYKGILRAYSASE